MTIGIIEDDRLLSRSLKVVLEKEGYRTLQVYTKKDAGQILQGTEELLLVDIGLPDGNGMELYHTLMKKWNRKIPAIFLTARDEEQEMLKAFDLARLAEFDPEGVAEHCKMMGIELPKEKPKKVKKQNRGKER